MSTTTAPTTAGEPGDNRTPAMFALLGTSLIWGTAPLATKSVLEEYSPYVLASTRWAIAIAVMLVLLKRMGIRPVLDRRAVVLGLTGILLFNFFFSYGLERTSAANAALIGGALPVVIAVMSFLLLHERLSPLRWSGIAISMCGIAATVLGATLEASLLGNLLMFGSTFVWAIYTLYVRERMRGEAAMAITCGGAIYGLAMMIPFAAIEATQESYPAPDLGTIVQVLYLSVGPSMGAILLWSFALSRVPASTAGVFSNLAPIVGIVAAGIILSEPITRYHIIGASLVIAGVLVTTYRRRPAA